MRIITSAIVLSVAMLSNQSHAAVVYTHTAQIGDSDAIFQTNLVSSNNGASNGGRATPPIYETGLEVKSNIDNSTTKSGVSLNTETGFLRTTLQSQIETLDTAQDAPNARVTTGGVISNRFTAVGAGTLRSRVKLHGEWDYNTGFDIIFSSSLNASIQPFDSSRPERQTRFQDVFSLATGQQPRNGEINEFLDIQFELFDGDVLNWNFQWAAQLFNTLNPKASFGNNLFNLGDTIQFGAFELSDGLSLVSDDPSFLALASNLDNVPGTPVSSVSTPAIMSILMFGMLCAVLMRENSRS